METAYFEATIAALSTNHHEFTSVNLSGHSLAGDKASRLALSLSKNTYVHTLELHDLKDITEEGWADLARALPAQLHTLDLSQCHLSDNGIFEKYICDSLKRMHGMVELDLSSNDISASTGLLEALSAMHNLGELLLQHNKFGTEGARQVVLSISVKSPLERIWFQNNDISVESRAEIKSLASQRGPDGMSFQIEFGN